MLGHAGFTAELLDQPLLHCPGVQHCLCCGECLRDHHYQSCLGGKSTEGTPYIDWIHIRQESQIPALGLLSSLRVSLQRLEYALNTKVGSANANANDISEGFASVTNPLTGTHLV